MGIKLESIELKNIRSHSYFLFEPREKGITVLSGENGTGKSSIVNSLAWTLYSTKPKGVSRTQGIMKSGVPYKKGDFYSEVVLKIDDEYMKVRKTITNKSGGAECQVWTSPEKDVWPEKETAGPAITHAENYIKRRLQMDEKDFLTSVLVQQKQVDQLIVATPADRSQVIEKLTGISSITEAVRLARKEYKDLQSTLGGTHVNKDGLIKLREEEEENRGEIESLTEKEKCLKKRVEELQAEREDLSKRADEEDREYRKREKLQNRIDLLEVQKKNLSDSLEKNIQDKDLKKDQLSKMSRASQDIESIERSLLRIDGELREINAEMVTGEQYLKELSVSEREYSEIQKKSSIKTLSEAEKKSESNSENLAKAEERETLFNQEKYAQVGQLQSLKNAMEVIKDHEGSCPTCMQEVSDVPETISNLERQYREAEDKISSVEERSKKIQTTISRLKENEEKFQRLIESFDLSEVRKEMREVEKSSNLLEAKKKTLEAEKNTLQKLSAQSENYSLINKEYSLLLERAQSESVSLEKLEKEYKRLKEKLDSLKVPSLSVISKHRDHLSKVNEDVIKGREDLIKTESSKALLEEKSKGVRKEIKTLEEDLERYEKLLKSVEISLNSVKVLEEFRIDRIKSSVSIIESYASEFLSEFTDHEFSGLKLDQKFNATVLLPDGEERVIGLLSGGELSAAALALRLAIAFLLSSDDDKNLLILDEVLVSQDSSRVQTILDSIKESIKGQVILIAHNENIKSIADKVVELS